MRRTRRFFPTMATIIALVVLSSTWALSASANFHLWEISEVYSNANESVQFIELTTTFNGQQVLNGHSLLVGNIGGTLAVFDFMSNLPSSTTSNQSFLLGTQSLADLPGGVTPDYVIAAGFIDVTLATILNFASVDFFSLSGLPLDGANSLLQTGLMGTATPTNFAGAQGVVPEPTSALLIGLGLAALGLRGRP